MTRVETDQSLGFSYVFANLLVVAWAATIVWIDLDHQLLGKWPVVVLWISIFGAWVAFCGNSRWRRWAAVGFFLSGLMLIDL